MFDRKGGRKYLNKSERKAFFIAARKLRNKSERGSCLFLYYTGCRISEALSVCPASLDVSERNVVIETLKRRKKGVFRSIPIPNKFVRLLRDVCKDLEVSEKIWSFSRTTGYRLIKSCMKAARINGAMASPKGLRHGFAVACIQENIALTVVKTWMGHARLETTAIYLNVTGQEERTMAKRLWKRD